MKRGRRQVAREGDEGLEERLERLERAHRDAERHCETAASMKPPTTRQTVTPMSLMKLNSANRSQPATAVLPGVRGTAAG